MKKHIKLNETQLRNMVTECVKKTLKEFISPVQPTTDYEGNDLNYEHLFDDALKVIDEMNDGVTEIRWQDVAQRMGYHLDTLNEDDMELLHDAIEDAMAVPGIEEGEPIQVNETKIAKIVAESVKKVLKEDSYNEIKIAKIVAESIKKALKEYGGTPQTLGSVAQNVSRRTDQMNSVYNTTLSNGQERGKAVGNLFNSQQYLAKAIQNAIANGMTEEEIQQVLQQNLGSNYNPQFKNGTLYWGRK